MIIQCPVCSASFERNGRRVYCSAKCKKKNDDRLYRLRHGERLYAEQKSDPIRWRKKLARDHRWRQENKDKTAAYFKQLWQTTERKEVNRRSKTKARFGDANINAIIEFGCHECGLTNEASLAKWGERLCVDHIDNNGRRVKNPNNDEANLQALCRSCHASKTFSEDYRVVANGVKVPLK